MTYYADICVVYGSKPPLCTVYRWVRKFSVGVESIKMHLHLLDQSVHVVRGLLKQFKQIVKSDPRCNFQQIRTQFEIQKRLSCAFCEIF